MRREVRRTWIVMVVGTTTALGACSASVDRFDASAPYTCPGRSVRIEWKVTGCGTMSVDPPTPGAVQGHVADEGAIAISPVSRTKVKLSVSRVLGGSTSSEIWIDVDAGRKSLMGIPDCDATYIWTTVQAGGFDPTLRIESVSAARELDVAHDGRTAKLAPNTSTLAFRGTPVDGTWTLKGPLIAGEKCGEPSIPPNLIIDTTSQCGGAP